MENVLEDSLNEVQEFKRRRKLLPWWIKIFCWLFMFFGLISVVCLFLGFTNFKPSLAIYGLESNEPFSIMGISIIMIGILKGITAFGLWFEKDFGVKLGKIDGSVGILTCLLSMVVLPLIFEGYTVTIRLELILLIPFLMKLHKIESSWDKRTETNSF